MTLSNNSIKLFSLLQFMSKIFFQPNYFSMPPIVVKNLFKSTAFVVKKIFFALLIFYLFFIRPMSWKICVLFSSCYKQIYCIFSLQLWKKVVSNYNYWYCTSVSFPTSVKYCWQKSFFSPAIFLGKIFLFIYCCKNLLSNCCQKSFLLSSFCCLKNYFPAIVVENFFFISNQFISSFRGKKHKFLRYNP